MVDLDMTPWVLEVSRGLPFDAAVRAAGLVLALAETRPVQAFLHEDAPPWGALLSAADLRRLHALTPRAGRALALQGERRFWLRAGSSVPPRPPDGQGLIAVSSAYALAVGDMPYYASVHAFGVFPAGAEVLPLPAAVDRAAFAPQGGERPLHVLVVGSGAVQRDARLVAWVEAACTAPITLFDPYTLADLAAVASARVRFIPAGPPRRRAEAFAPATVVLTARPRLDADNQFLWEAVRMRAVPLTAYLAARPDAWTAPLLTEALEAHERGDVAAAGPEAVDFSDLPGALASPAVATAEPSTLTLGGARLIHAASESLALTPPAATPAAPPRVAIVLAGPGAAWDDASMAPLASYTHVYLEVTSNPELMLQVLSQVTQWVSALVVHGAQARHAVPLVQALQRIDDIVAVLERHTRAPSGAHVDILHVADSRSRVRAVRELLQAYVAAKAEQPEAPLPTLLAYRAKGDVTLPSTDRMGGPVATHNFLTGLLQATRGRLQVRYLESASDASQAGRVYFYPPGQGPGRASDQLDFAGLPAALRQDSVDLVYVPGSLLWRPAMARSLWARRPLPIVGMLHSIHASVVVSEALMTVSNCRTYPFDALISPSACGKAAFEGLLAAVDDWLRQRDGFAEGFRGSIEVIPYGIETAYYRGVDQAACRLALEIPVDRQVLLSLARFHKREKMDLMPLLLACKELARRHADVLLILAGSDSNGAYGDEVRGLIGSLGLTHHVRVAPDISFADKVLMYGAADVFVSIADNIQETYGLTLLEAMAAGLPVVASDWNGYRELVRHDETGLRVPTLWAPVAPELAYVQYIAAGIEGYSHRDLHESIAVDPLALCAQLDALLKNPEARRAMGARGRHIVCRDYELLGQSEKVQTLLADRLAAARVTVPDPRPAPAPFVDPVGARFAHYTPWHLTDATVLRPTAWATEPGWLGTVLSGLRWGSDDEKRLVHACLTLLEDRGPQRVDALEVALATGVWQRQDLRLRLVRCIKYGILTAAAPA